MDIVTTLKHPKFGLVSDKHEQIEVSDERKCDLENAFTFSLELSHRTATDKFFFSLQKSFVNLYQTLSEAVHNCGLRHEEDMLPTADLNENTFSKSDALALGKSNSFLIHLFLFFL